MKNKLYELRRIRAELNNLGEILIHDITDEYDNITIQNTLDEIDADLNFLMDKVSEYVDN